MVKQKTSVCVDVFILHFISLFFFFYLLKLLVHTKAWSFGKVFAKCFLVFQEQESIYRTELLVPLYCSRTCDFHRVEVNEALSTVFVGSLRLTPDTAAQVSMRVFLYRRE